VSERPADHGEFARGSAGVFAWCFGSSNGRVEHTDGVLLGMPQVRIRWMQLTGPEHQVEQRRVGQRKRDVGVSHRGQRRRNLTQGAGELGKALGSNGRQQRGPVAEVILRRGVRHAGDAASLGHLDLDDLDNVRAFDTKKAYATSNFASGTTSNWRFIYSTPLRHVALISPEKGTRTLLWLVNGTPGTTWTPGLFYAKNKPKTPNPQAADDALAASLWNRSAGLAGLPATT
jgi:hypothetical protein